jgi:hypothetical protein
LALAGLIVPVIIHLWNVKQGKTLKIGSISLLGESSRASSKSFRITDWLLFLLRCLLIILIGFILAQPYLKKILNNKSQGGWILVSRADFPGVFKNNHKTIDSLIKTGYEIHDFDIGFKQILLQDTLNTNNQKQKSGVSTTTLLQQLNLQVPSGFKVYLYTNRLLNNFGENLPKINYKLIWESDNSNDTSGSWIATFSGKKYEAKSNPDLTSYKALNVNDTPLITVALYESGHSDAKYIRAALAAISSFSGRKIEISNWNNQSASKADIGFWLSDQPVNQNFKTGIHPDGILFSYEKGKIINEKSFIKFGNNDLEQIDLNKWVDANDQFKKIWTDGFGHPILTREKTGQLNVFHFYSRLNPQWTNLIWNAQFVKILMPIVIKDENFEDFGFENNPADQRTIAKNQKEVIQTNTLEKAEIKTLEQPINYIFWVIAMILFTIERILSFSKKPKAAYVKN